MRTPLARRKRAHSVALALALACWGRTALGSPVVVPSATAAPLPGGGQGLCVASATSTSPATDFPQSAGAFDSGMNGFLDAKEASWIQAPQTTIFDRSNGEDTGPKVSWGDFANAMVPACPAGGCPFPWNDTTTSFGSRFRGFLNVTSALAGAPIHVGIYADDGVGLTFFDKSGKAYPVLTQPVALGSPTWRMTETVTFVEAGLYPVEIVYAQIVEHAALEVSFFQGSFQDFQLPASQMPVVDLATSGFTLFDAGSFFQTESGEALASCAQCDRQFVGQVGNNGCPPGMLCNAAALCGPCDSADACGPTCSPCGGATPYCIGGATNFACGACRTSADCAGSCCDPSTHACIACGGPDAGSGGAGGTSGAGGAGGAASTDAGPPDGSMAEGSASSSSTMGGGGAGGAGATGGAASSPGQKGGCGCEAAAASADAPALAVWLALALARRRRTRPRR